MENEIKSIDLYKDNRDHARHHESQRTTMSNLILIVSAAIGAVVAADRNLAINDLPLTIFISAIGLFGVVFSIKYGFRISYHLSVSNKILKADSPELHQKVSEFQRKSEMESSYPFWIVKQQNTLFWVILHSTIIAYGLVLSILCVIS